MKNPDIVKRLARQSGVTAGQAADRLDRAVQQILSNPRRRKDTPFPGLGKFTRGAQGGVAFRRQKDSGRD